MSAVCYLSVKAMLLLMDCRVQVATMLDKSSVVDNQKITVKNRAKMAKTKSNKGKEYVELATGGGADSDLEDDDLVGQNGGGAHLSENNNSRQKDITYSDVAFAAFGKSGRIAVDTALLVTQVRRKCRVGC